MDTNCPISQSPTRSRSSHWRYSPSNPMLSAIQKLAMTHRSISLLDFGSVAVWGEGLLGHVGQCDANRMRWASLTVNVAPFCAKERRSAPQMGPIAALASARRDGFHGGNSRDIMRWLVTGTTEMPAIAGTTGTGGPDDRPDTRHARTPRRNFLRARNVRGLNRAPLANPNRGCCCRPYYACRHTSPKTWRLQSEYT
jgi:hypothetical protein